MTVATNTVRFLYNQNDLTTNNLNSLTFIFGSPNIIPCVESHLINRENNTFRYNCGCTNIDRDNNIFIVKCNSINDLCGIYWIDKLGDDVSFDCPCEPFDNTNNTNINIDCSTGNEPQSIIFTNARAAFGYNIVSRFSIDFYNIEFNVGYSSTATTIIAANMRMYSEISFGYYSNSNLIKSALLPVTYNFGYYASSNLLYDPYNKFNENQIGQFLFGYTSLSNLLYNPYNAFNENQVGQFLFGYDLQNNFIFNPYNQFLDGTNNYTSSYFGYETVNNFIFNPYNQFNQDQIGTFSFGYSLQNNFIFNPYNQFDYPIYSYFGYDSSSSIKYSDDPYISPEIIYNFGYVSTNTVKYGNIIAKFDATNYFGYDTNSWVSYQAGFIADNYFGHQAQLRNIITSIRRATFINCISYFGISLHVNSYSPFYFDLSRTNCCTKIHKPLLHIEMSDEHDYDVKYGNHRGWGFASIADLQTQPRFYPSFSFGYSSSLIDNTIYIGHVEMSFGHSANVRGLYYEKNYDISYGNIIVDQNEIKVELTKPLDEGISNNKFDFGYSSWANLGASYALGTARHFFGYYSYHSLTVDEAMRGKFWFGYASTAFLNRRVSFIGENYVGFISTGIFYEEPYYMHFGYSAECNTIITENYVEFLEEGELINEYIYQTPNGDRDMDRPYQESIEGNEFIHALKGRCF